MSSQQHVFISPHFDDVVWSCGGYLAKLVQAGESVTVITVFSHLDCQPVGNDWRRLAVIPCRVTENQKAVDLLGADVVDLGFAEAAIRVNMQNDFVYQQPQELFVSQLSEFEILHSVQREINQWLPLTGSVYLPMALGRHVDHVLVHHLKESMPEGLDIRFYADFPYALEHAVGQGWRGEKSEIDLDAWVQSACCYRSQVRSMFSGQQDFINQLHAYSQAFRVWHHA